MSIRIPIALVLAVIAASPAFAQPGQESAAAVARIDTERRCIEAQRDRLAGALLRLGNTRQAISSGAPGSPAVAAAIRTASELEIEIRTIGNDIARCANPAAEQPPTVATSGQSTTTSGTQPPAVLPVATNVQRTQEGISSQRPVVEQGTPIVRDRVLSANLKLVLGERLDGSGVLDDAIVVQGLANVAPRVEACYEALNTRAGSVQRGDVQLFFTVLTNRHHPDGMRLADFTVRDRTFQECVAHAFGQAHVATLPTGGPIRYRMRLRFGPY